MSYWLVAGIAIAVVGLFFLGRRKTQPSGTLRIGDPLPEIVFEGWRAVYIGFDEFAVTVGGFSMRDGSQSTYQTVELPHPAYPNQRHNYYIFEMGPTDSPVRVAISELSNGVWGAWTPVD